MKFIIFLFIVSCFIGCGSQYNLLKPVSYLGEDKYWIDKYRFYLAEYDTIKIRTYTTTWRDGDIAKKNLLFDFLVQLQLKNVNDKWKNDSLYFLVDADNSIFYPFNVSTYELPKDEDPYVYEYTVWFSPNKNKYIKFPLEFNFIDTNNKQHKIIYTFEEKGPEE